MSELSSKYRRLLQELEDNIKDEEKLKFVKDKFAELSMMFIDILDRVTELTDAKVKKIEKRQQDIDNRINSVQSVLNEIENDIYEDNENYEFEIVCPYCNHEFTADIEEDGTEEVKCPECQNIIELDWNCEANDGCTSNCSTCGLQCAVAEDSEEYDNDDENEKSDEQDSDEDEDM